MPFLEDLDLFAVFAAPAPTINQLPTLKGLRHEYIPKLLILNFAVFVIEEKSRN